MRISISMGLFLLLAISNTFIACSQSSEVKNIDSSALQKLLKDNKIQLVDVRTDREFNSGYITGAKHINIASSDFVQQIEKLDQSKPIVLYCAVGGRSTAAVRMIKQLDFPVIYNFVGGMREWNSKGLPLQKP